MKHVGRLMLSTLGLFGLFAVTLTTLPSHPATAAPAGPTVTVTPLPLPVTGSVNAAVSGTVGVNNFPATLTGASVPVSGNVGINGNVKVGNPLDASSNPIPLRTRDVNLVSSQAFTARVNCDLSLGCEGITVLSVAPRAVTVVQSVSGGCVLTGSASLQLNQISLAIPNPTNSGLGAFVTMVPVLTGGSSGGAAFTSFVFSVPTQFDVANTSSSSGSVILQLSTNAGFGACDVSLVGYTISAD